ncbi:MAG TPA: hypothetical protein VGO43_05345 [Pyrinomonadaceae bacterium]|jgi:hypothetical protein|nr:hypothetical protein [Pyrinomonadaceae bacterium]
MTIELFTQLGDEIERLWLAENYNEELLPSIAKEALLKADIPSKATPWEAVEWALTRRELPQQQDLAGRFGEPPVTLYVSARFHIDLYFWFTSTTSLHQHGFCGAFQVFEGSSIHSWYEFERNFVVNSFLETGSLDLKSCRILNKGMVQEIWPGSHYIHSLFHLDEPSVTIVVRTHRSPLHLPQFSYHKPGLAVDPFFEHPTSTKKIQLVSAVLRAKREEGDGLLTRMLETNDLQTSFSLLSSVRGLLRGDHMDRLFDLGGAKTRFEGFLNIVEGRHGEKAAVLRPVFEYMELLEHLSGKRAFVTEPDHRFLFALLLNADGREHILGLLRQRYPDGDAVGKLLDWVFELSQTRVVGQPGNALGVIEFSEPEMYALEGLLRGREDVDIAAAYLSEAAKAKPEDIPNALKKIRESLTFRPLLS